jgi:hypothetical protein
VLIARHGRITATDSYLSDVGGMRDPPGMTSVGRYQLLLRSRRSPGAARLVEPG